MIHRWGPIERLLRGAGNHWRWLRLLRQTLILGSAVAGLVLLLGLGMVRGWFQSGGTVTALFVALGVAVSAIWMCLALLCAVVPEDRSWLAASLERVHRPLLDRLNTLMFLRGKRHPYEEQIERQAATVARCLPTRVPFSLAPLRAPSVVFVVFLLATIWFFAQFSPWEHVHAVAASLPPPADTSSDIPEIPPSPESPPSVERPETPWGEVRIVRPGVDLRATPLDVIPLRIEAAASRPLADVAWFWSVNGDEPQREALPRPESPSFAAYEPELDLPSLEVETWDVVCYYAEATVADGQHYASSLYFVEVFPFREELKRLADGPQGINANPLRELTTLIERQQQVLRDTRQQQELGDTTGAEGAREREALAREEAELSAATRHLSADLEGRLEKQSAEQLQPSLRAAQTSLQEAEKALRDNTLTPAMKSENAALAALVKARQQFHEELRRRTEEAARQAEAPPESDAEKTSNSLESALEEQIQQYAKIEQQAEQFPPDELKQTTDETRRLLERLEQFAERPPPQEPSPSELRKELNEKNKQELQSQCDKLCQDPDATGKQQAAGALKQGLQKLSQALAADRERRSDHLRQREMQEMEDRAAEMERRQQGLRSARQAVQRLLAEERQLERQAKPRAKKPQPELAEQQRNLQRQLEQLRREDPQSFATCQQPCASASSAMGQAAESLRTGKPDSQSLAGRAAQELQKLDDALEREQQAGRLAEAHQLKRMLDQQIEQLQKAETDAAAPEQLDRAAQRSQSLTGQLKQMAEEQPTAQQFSEPLRQALSDEKKQQIDQACAGVCQGQGAAKGKAAGSLRQRLEEVSRAFDASVPGRRGQGERESLTQEGPPAIEEGLRRLESLARRAAQSRPGDLRLGQEALESFQAGLESTYGYNERTQETLRELEEEVKQGERPIDIQLVRELLRGIQQVGRESVTAAKPDEAQKTQIDPARLPPAYRKSIERYYQKLSEQR